MSNEALMRFKTTLRIQRQQGAENFQLSFAEAVYAAAAGDKDATLDKLAQSFDAGFTFDPQLSKILPMFQPFEDDPRFAEIMSRMVDHLNAERAKLGLEPMAI